MQKTDAKLENVARKIYIELFKAKSRLKEDNMSRNKTIMKMVHRRKLRRKKLKVRAMRDAKA